jgi:hypothetical protein
MRDGGEDAICPAAVLDYVVPSRANVVLYSPGRVAVTLDGTG